MSMLDEKFQELLSQPNNAIIAVNRPDGGPQLTPVWYLWDGEAFYFSTTRDRSKYPNIKRNPSISLIIDDLAMHMYVAAYGQAEILEKPPVDIVRKLLSKYVPAERVEQATIGATDPTRVLVKLRPDKIVPR